MTRMSLPACICSISSLLWQPLNCCKSMKNCMMICSLSYGQVAGWARRKEFFHNFLHRYSILWVWFLPSEYFPIVATREGICSHFAYISVRLLSFCLHVSFCLQMCIIPPTYGYVLGGLSRCKTDFALLWLTTQGDLVPLSKNLEGKGTIPTLIDSTGWL